MRGIKAVILCAALSALFSACQNAPAPQDPDTMKDGALISIDGAELSGGEIRYLLTVAAGQLELEGKLDWNGSIGTQTVREYLREKALEMAVTARVTDVKANELGYGLTDAEAGEIDWELALATDYLGGRDAFLDWLAETGLTEEQYRFYNYEVPALQDKLLYGLYGEDGPYKPDEAEELLYYNINYITASYIFLSATDEVGEPLSGAQWDTQKAIAEALRRQAVGGEDFTGMVETHGQDYLMSLSPEGMPVQLGHFGGAFDAALSALGEGEISEVVTATEGFYIIKRLPPDWEWFERNRDDVWYYCASDAFLKKLIEWGQELNVAVGSGYEAIDPREWTADG